jgi:hypothetical protein
MTMRLCLLFVLLVVVTSCARHEQQHASSSAPAKLMAADLAKLRWIEGNWRGSGVDQAPFFERYRFENDTTLAVDSFPDEKLEKVDDTSRYELKDGQFTNGSYVASAIDEQGISFEPIPGKAKNSFRWQRQSADKWTAILKWPAVNGKPARERIYNMERILRGAGAGVK